MADYVRTQFMDDPIWIPLHIQYAYFKKLKNFIITSQVTKVWLEYIMLVLIENYSSWII
jgi:hypothetical protein